MRFIVYGAGAIGSVIGGHLFRQGYQVVLVGNAQHIDAINERGLKLVTGAETFMLQVPAVKTAQELAPFTKDDIVLLCAKSQQTVKCLGQLKNAGAPRTLPLFSLQNSLVNESVATRMFDRIYGAMIMLPAIFLLPGEVINPILAPQGVMEIGCYPRGRDGLCEQLAAALNASGFHAEVHPRVMESKAAKCLINQAIEGRQG
jgi:2-dehydropantoate 2-reductase